MPTGDGLLVRFLPARSIAVDAFIAFCAASRRHGNGTIEISARGSLQARGLAAHSAPSFASAVAALGIAAADGVPVIASPLDDHDALIDADALAAELRLAVAGTGLALAPKVSIVVDGGGRAHLDAVPADIRLRAIGQSREARLCIGIGGDGASATWLGTVKLREASAAVVALLRAVEAVGPDGRAADLLHAAGSARTMDLPMRLQIEPTRHDARPHAAQGIATAPLTYTDAPLPRTLSAATPSGAVGLLRVPAEALDSLRNALREAFARATRESPAEPGKITLGEIPAEGVQRINEALRQSGVPADVSGYHHEVDNYAARHVFKEHGATSTEALRGQVAITADDWAMIPDVLAAPERVDYVEKTGVGRDGIAVLKRVNGHLLIVEEVRTGRRTLAVVTIRKFLTGGDVPGRPDAPKDPQSHVQDALPGNANLPDRHAVRKVAAPAPDVEPNHVRLSMVRSLSSASPPLRPPAEMIGLHPLRDGKMALGVALAFGHAGADSLARLASIAAEHGATTVRPTAGRTLLLLGVAENGAAALADAAERLGFITRPDDPRRRIAACPGAPACASGLIPARAMAAALARALAPDNALPAPRVDRFGPQRPAGEVAIHLSGCRKGCAHPAPAAVTVVGTERGCGIVRGGSARGAPQRFVAPAHLAGEIVRIAASLREAAHG